MRAMTTAALMEIQDCIQAMERAKIPIRMPVIAPATAKGSCPGGPGIRGDKPGAKGFFGKAGVVTACMTAPFTNGEPVRTDLPGAPGAEGTMGGVGVWVACGDVASALGTVAVTAPASANSACTTSAGKLTGA